jgi:5'/3'-nucleotidase
VASANSSVRRSYNARMPRILVTNDDGVYSEGLRKLADVCRTIGEVIIVAPDREQSAASHALTLNRPLRMMQIEQGEWIVDGTPTDCVNLGILKLMRSERPDLIVSGINFGPNLGDDVTYSGTISAAFEGALLDVPSIAFSALVGEHFSFDRCATFAGELARIALDQHRDPRIVLNVNFPVGEFGGVKITRLGRRIYSEGVIERLDPRGRKYYWIGGEPPVWHPEEGTDFDAVQQGYVSITPLHLDLTHHESIPRLRPLEEMLGHLAAKR